MKLRYGFVSNSSSSSFIVHSPDQTTAQTMREMLKLVKAEWKEEKTGRKMINAITKVIKWLQSHPKFDKPLLYPNTCNYETWVYKNDEEDLRIDTCNNHDSNWDSMNFDYMDEEYEGKKELEYLNLETMKTQTYKQYNDEWLKRHDLQYGKTLTKK